MRWVLVVEALVLFPCSLLSTHGLQLHLFEIGLVLAIGPCGWVPGPGVGPTSS